MYSECIVCESAYERVILNELPMRKCVSCGLVWRETFDRHPHDYVESEGDLSKFKIEARLRNAIGRINTLTPSVDFTYTCDIGCGEGVFLMALQKSGFRDCFGIEPSIHAQTFGGEHAVSIRSGTIEDFPKLLQGEAVTVATLFHVIEHLEDPLTALKIVYAALPYGATIVLETPDIAAYQYRRLEYRHPLIYPDHLWYFNTQTLHMLLEKAGFHVVHEGRRDFDVSHMGVKSLLEYYGFFKKSTKESEVSIQSSIHSHAVEGSPLKTRGVIRSVLAFLLRWGITLLGRENYIWIVGKK